MPSSSSLAFAALLLASCTTFSGADIDPPGGDAGSAGAMSGSSGHGGSLAPGGAGQGGVAGGASGSGGQAGLAGMSGGAAGDGGPGGSDSGASGDGGSSGQSSGGTSGSSGQTGGSGAAGSSAGGSAGGASGAAGSTGGTAGTTSGASGAAGTGGGAGSSAGSGGSGAGAGGSGAGQGGSGGASCGDGVVQMGEECDDGPGNSPTGSGCSTACVKICPTNTGGVSVKSGATCYFSLGGAVDWSKAKDKCSSYGGKGHYVLASLESLAEFNAIKGQATTFGFDGFWIGGHRVGDQLTWLSGPAISFTSGMAPWGKNEPDSSFDCVAVDTNFVSATMITDDCTEEHIPLCEW